MIVAGFGFRAAATTDSLRAALIATGVTQVDAIATPADKAITPAFAALARQLGVPVHCITPPAMQTEKTATKSAKVLAKRGTGSVAEACALAAAGTNATLQAPRFVSPDKMATCAIAQGADT